MEETKGRVCVTGGAGFIGSSLIMKLLQNGYCVNTTVRPDPEYKEDPSFLYDLPGASQRLQVFHADLKNPQSFSSAIEGCIGVFHVATPVDSEIREQEEVVTKRTVDGALGILKACLNSKTVKRVIYTSSSAAVNFNGKEEQLKDESSWSDVDSLRASKFFACTYPISKTLTEKAVLEFGEENGLDVVTLLPTFVFGPFICPKLPSSVKDTLDFAFGRKGDFGLIVQAPMVHVDDVVRAHIFLLEHSNPKGRYICSRCLVTSERISELVSAKYPKFQPPTDSSEQIKVVKIPDLSSKKLTDAGFVFKYGLEEMVDDAIKCCIEKGYL